MGISDPAIPPTGWLDPPVRSMVPLLDLKVSQRYSPYLEEDGEGVFVIDTSVSFSWSAISRLRCHGHQSRKFSLLNRKKDKLFALFLNLCSFRISTDRLGHLAPVA